MKRTTIISGIFGIVILTVIINFLGSRYFVRLDFTADKIYTLNKSTKDIITQLPKTVSVTAYFTEDLPPDIARVRKEFMELLVEYYNISKGKVVFEFIDPSKKPGDEEQAQQKGIQPLVANLRDKDQVKQQKVYLGAVVQMDDKQDVIPFLKPGATMEYALSSSIKKVSVDKKPSVGFLTSEGEPSLGAFQQVMGTLSVLYEVEPFKMYDSVYSLSKYLTMVITAPQDSFSPAKLQQLDRYLNEGGNIFLAMNRVEGDFKSMQGKVIETGLEKWLKNRGLEVSPEFIVDAGCATVNVMQQQGGMQFQTQMPFPFFPMITKFANHPITKGLESVVLRFCSPMKFTASPGVSFQALAMTSAKSGILKMPLYFDVNKQWSEKDFGAPGMNIAGILTGKGNSGKEWKMVVISDGNFAENGQGREAQQLQPDNVSLMANSVDWLSDQTGLLELRTKEVSSRPLGVIDDGKKLFLKYLNFLLPILLVVGYGLFRMERNRNMRIRRMHPGYV